MRGGLARAEDHRQRTFGQVGAQRGQTQQHPLTVVQDGWSGKPATGSYSLTKPRETARSIVATHGPNLVTEDVDIRTWMLRLGHGIAPFSPGVMLAALAALHLRKTSQKAPRESTTRCASTRTSS